MATARNDRTFIMRVEKDGRISYVNDEWLAFARENEAPELTKELVCGRPALDFIAGHKVRRLFRHIHISLCRSGSFITYPYRCDSPTQYRLMQMTVIALPGCRIEFRSHVLQTVYRLPVPLYARDFPRSGRVYDYCSFCSRIYSGAYGWINAVDAAEAETPNLPPRLNQTVCQDCWGKFRDKEHPLQVQGDGIKPGANIWNIP